MIVDKIKNMNLYKDINPKLAKAFKWIQQNDLSKFELGKHIIDDDMFFVHRTLEMSKPNDMTCEVHNHYADIHLFKEKEVYGYIPVNYLQQLEPITDYDTAMDVRYYKAKKALGLVEIEPDNFMLFLPNEIHCPGIVSFSEQYQNNKLISKYILKVKMN
ncbi:YhcH/YjgK/YiaL family protein [Mycoplasma nasistruthionis]|uniref:DUF386 domain-containing protein n=1 Tax=Mycoplasma nasistruthionis TaxID=353852 RepID=A0A5B7XVW6_9MOLU|nr:YhcH/YjgK/YiaL family protein [Mycoplasma nasistruthionis]QCZ36919.1 DUF386 domain-containing protein [Mycoplasma nasistruthionis]